MLLAEGRDQEQPGRPSLHAFRLQGHGLERVLGSMEAAIMEALWAAGRPLRIAEVRDALAGAGQSLSFNAVMTVMHNLVAKGLLTRQRGAAGRASTYAPRLDRSAFVAELARQVAQGLVRDFGPLAVSPFLDVLREEDAASLELLRRWLEGEGGRARPPQ